MLSRKRSDTTAVTRGRLIKAARLAFAEHGYAKASMDDFAASVGLTRGALYHQFGSKEGLLAAVVAEIDGEILLRIAQEGRHITDPWQNFREGSRSYLRLALEPEIQRILLKDAPAVLGTAERAMHAECLPATAQKLAALMDAGVVVRTDALALARLLSGALTDAALWIANSDDPATELQTSLAAFDVLLDGLRASQPAHRKEVANA